MYIFERLNTIKVKETLIQIKNEYYLSAYVSIDYCCNLIILIALDICLDT